MTGRNPLGAPFPGTVSPVDRPFFMSADRWNRLNDLYHVAVALAADERAEFLSEACADDPSLQADVERLAAAHDRVRPFTEPAGVPQVAPQPTDNAPAEVDPGFGPYRLERELGRGRTGPVYLATLDEGQFQQRVALRVIEHGMDAGLVLERFKSARLILTSRDHPNIARLVDAGTTTGGQTYLVVEHVDGQPLDVYAENHRLSIAERLQLFLQICNAVAYAHRRGVTHGRIASPNILVTAAGVPKLLDFGVGELQASPASDVESLGTVLDELVMGRSSDRSRQRIQGDLDAIVRMALRKDPGRRYESVEQLSDDLRKHLEGPPVRARPATSRRRAATPASPEVRRARALFAWGLATVAVTLLGVRISELPLRQAEAEPAAPVIEKLATRDRVVVVDLADHVGDPSLVAALSDAFRVGLAESSVMRVLSPRQLRASAGTTVDSVGRAVARRQGVKMFVTSRVESPAGAYTFTADVTSAENAELLATVRETAADSADVVPALSRLAERLREKVGESAASIAATPRLDEITTASLPALRQYASAVKALGDGDRVNGVRLLKSAVTLDTGFASAHRLLATAYSEMSDRTRSAASLEHVVANRSRLPFYDRDHTSATYARTVLGDNAAAIDAYNRILARYPNDIRALTNLGAVRAARKEYAAQESLLVRAIAVDPNTASLHTALAIAHVNTGRYDDARTVLDQVGRRFPGLRATQLAEVALAASKRDWDTAEREARARVPESPDDSTGALDGLETLAGIVMTQGRLEEAERDLRRVMALGARGGSPRRSLIAGVRLAYIELRYRHAPTAAVATMNAALARFPLSRMDESGRPYDEVARLLADAGQPARAKDLVAQAARTRTGSQRGVDANRRWTLGAIAMAESRAWEGEFELHQAAAAHVCPICALPDLARAYEVSGKPDSAIATYERYVNAPWQSRVDTDAIELGSALRRLGELYQQRNERVKAALQYSALIQLWRRADPELEPLLTDVRRRLEQTTDVAASRN